MPSELTAKQARFCTEYLIDLNGRQAAIRAGYSPKTAESQASTLLRNPKVAARVAELQQRRTDRVEIKADDVLRELLTFARADIGKAFDADGQLLPLSKMPEDVRRAISAVETEEHTDVETDKEGNPVFGRARVRKVKFWDKPKGLELLMKHLGMLVEKHQHELGPSFADLVLASLPSKPKDGAK